MMSPRGHFKTCIQLFKQGIQLSKRNPSLFKPAFIMGFINITILALFFLGFSFLMIAPQHRLLSLSFLLGSFIFLVPLRSFLGIRCMAASAYMIREQVARQRILSLKNAWQATKGHTAAYCLVLLSRALLRMCFQKNRLTPEPRSGLLHFLGLGMMSQLGDILIHYLIPLIALEGCSFKQACQRSQDLIKHAGVSVGGMFGVDVVSLAFRLFMLAFSLFLALLSTALGYLSLGLYGDFSLLPFLVSGGILISLYALTQPFFDWMKTLYFTSLYLALNQD